MENKQSPRNHNKEVIDRISNSSLFENLIWLNTKEASKYLRLSTNGLRTMVCRGQIVAYKLGNRLRFKKVDLDQLIESNSTKDLL